MTTSVKLPAATSVNVLGRDIPVTEYVTAGEYIAVERLIKRAAECTSLEFDLEVIAVYIRSRVDKTFTLDKYLKDDAALNVTAINEAAAALNGPFERAWKPRRLRNAELQAQQLEPDRLKEWAAERQLALSILQEAQDMLLKVLMAAEQTGSSSKP